VQQNKTLGAFVVHLLAATVSVILIVENIFEQRSGQARP